MIKKKKNKDVLYGEECQAINKKHEEAVEKAKYIIAEQENIIEDLMDEQRELINQAFKKYYGKSNG